MKTTKMRALALTVLLALTLAACSGGTSSKSSQASLSSSSESASEPPLSVAIPEFITIKNVEFSTELTELDLSGQDIADSDMELLKHMVSLTKLYLNANPHVF